MNEDNTKNHIPTCGMIVYKAGEEFYLQMHDIVRSGDKYTWAEGRPFQREQLQELAFALKKQNLSTLKLRDLLSERVLYFQPHLTGTRFIWYAKPQKYHLKFSDENIVDGQYFMPGLIFAVSDRKLYIFAFKGTEKPSAQTKLYHSPFYNVETNGVVCMGTIADSKKKAYLEEEIERWERRFFGGVFTYAHWSDSWLKGIKLPALMKKIKNAKAFPETVLTPMTTDTLEKFLRKFLEKSRNEKEEY